MKSIELLENRFHLKVPKRRSEKVKLRVLKKAVVNRGQSLIHKDVPESLPKIKGIWPSGVIFDASPESFQTKTCNRMRKLIVEKLKSNDNTKKECERIGDKPLQLFILYKLVNIEKKRDIDNYTKNIIDSLRLGGLFSDDNNHQIRFIASKVDYLEVEDKSYYRGIEKFIIFLDFFNEQSLVVRDFNSIFGGKR